MIVGGAKKKSQQDVKDQKGAEQQESPEEYVLRSIESRDYSGAATFIEFVRDELNLIQKNSHFGMGIHSSILANILMQLPFTKNY